MKAELHTKTDVQCYHCGDRVQQDLYTADGHEFCCLGCQSVYQILSANQMGNYYHYNTHPGSKQLGELTAYEYLDEPVIADKLIDFKNDTLTIVTFYIPAIHCSSCVWLLEHLYKIDPAVLISRTDFMKKQVTLNFEHGKLSLRGLVQLLVNIGYEPKITLQDVVKKNRKFSQNGLVAKIAVAGFCFGNSMMLSFPEYFGMAAFEAKYASFFGWMNLAFGVPVLLYSAADYFRSAWYSLRQRQLNLDVPLALGIAVLFVRTAVEVILGTGPGFADTLCGLVFFILIGRWVQQRTYHHISFERDYRSYFPVAVMRMDEGGEKPVPIAELKVDDRILIRNNEIVPADAILLKGTAQVDFSFVTGESEPVLKELGEVIYAGGRQLGEAIELEVVKPVSQSYLTSLWNREDETQQSDTFTTFSNVVSRYFTPALLAVAALSTALWLLEGDSNRAWGTFTAVLIIACPCALALSSPFTLSAALSIFDKNLFYVKNAAAVEKMATVDTLVFDKTGTISSPAAGRMKFVGSLSAAEQRMVASVCRNSGHPLSREIVKLLPQVSYLPVTYYNEVAGMGIDGVVNGCQLCVGNSAFVGGAAVAREGTHVYVAVDNQQKGYFELIQPWRENLAGIVTDLRKRYYLHLISGDNKKDKQVLKTIFPSDSVLFFDQLPAEKLKYVQNLRQEGLKVCMLGDGLNDAAALKQADMGIAVSDDVNNFSPGCDAILSGSAFGRLPLLFKFSKVAMKVIYISLGISLTYNVVGLSYAVQGTMSPLFAAILMPLSTITIIGFTTLATHYQAARLGLNRQKQ